MHSTEPIASLAAPAPPLFAPLERARGAARIVLRNDDGVTRIAENFQSGSAKARFPKSAAGAALDVVLLNTAGGVTGGDHLAYAVEVGAGAHAAASTQAAERVYRRRDGTAKIDTTLTVGAEASLDWLPQETILFDQSSLTRRLTADVHPSGRLLAAEAIVLGRSAMGESVRSVMLADSWRLRRNGTLVFADGLRLDGDSVAIMAGGATGKAAIALATVVLIAPDAEAALGRARDALTEVVGEGSASAWNGMLIARLLAPDGQALRAALTRLIETLRGTTMPRTWLC